MQLLENSKIDKLRWDSCIALSKRPGMYAKSWYLDEMCPGWKGVVGDDYSWIMPLTARRKYAISYLYQPAFTQHLGVYNCNETTPIPVAELCSLLQKSFLFVEFNVNASTPGDLFKGASFTDANNFVLDLAAPYKEIAQRYSAVLKKNLRRAANAHLLYEPDVDFRNAIGLYREQYGSRMTHVTGSDYQGFERVCRRLQEVGCLICRKVTNRDGELLAMILLLKDESRIYNVINVTRAPGKLLQANHFLIDSVLREFSTSGWIFDFEGSDLPGVKAFYESFSPQNEPYLQVYLNNLPWPVSILK